ncbi:MAG: DUF2924 domain-containing protein [Rhizobiaceae bacterium]|nr:DUF2924 domain-containing protein [Rhizobiaceae bacterium]
MHANAKLEREVALIGNLSRTALVERWIKAHGTPPPKGIKRPLLELSAAWQLQARRLGGLSASTRKSLLNRLGVRGNKVSAKEDGDEGSSPRAPSRQEANAIRSMPVAGTRLMREWNGRMHIVDVTNDGFLFDGKHYRSLSAIARRITGARWSGPRFFGL